MTFEDQLWQRAKESKSGQETTGGAQKMICDAETKALTDSYSGGFLDGYYAALRDYDLEIPE